MEEEEAQEVGEMTVENAKGGLLKLGVSRRIIFLESFISFMDVGVESNNNHHHHRRCAS